MSRSGQPPDLKNDRPRLQSGYARFSSIPLNTSRAQSLASCVTIFTFVKKISERVTVSDISFS
ncbi:hypothetical protein Leryth_017559 [Lithospermum erythrorhizon]|nr:hypothetical protein Leryth_017559 [Lithospermum erythrorhizon]